MPILVVTCGKKGETTFCNSISMLLVICNLPMLFLIFILMLTSGFTQSRAVCRTGGYRKKAIETKKETQTAEQSAKEETGETAEFCSMEK